MGCACAVQGKADRCDTASDAEVGTSSPLSAHRGFIGNGHFSRANQFLIQQGIQPIDWRLPAQV
jgi:Uracil DNA glycosylase